MAVAAIILAMASVQSGAAYGKTLFSAIGPQGVTALRTSFGALMLAAVWQPWRGGRLTGGQCRAVVAYGVALGGMNLLFYYAISRLPLGIAVAIEFTGPFTLALMNSRRPSDILWLALALAGLAALVPMGDLSSAVDPLGAVFALGAGIFWALYIYFGHRVAGQLPGGRASALGMGVAALVTLPSGIGHAGWDLLGLAVLLPGLAVALLSSAIPYSLEMVALKRLPPRTFGVLMSLEPALAALAGTLLISEVLTTRQLAAIACVICASAGSTASSRHR